MRKTAKRILVPILVLLLLLCSVLLLLLYSGCGLDGDWMRSYKTGAHFFDYERTWACEELFIETFCLGGVYSLSDRSDSYAIWKFEGKEVRLSFFYAGAGNRQIFYLSLTEEEKAREEAGENVEKKVVWFVSSKLDGETLTITVTDDDGYENGLYSVDHTGKTFVLTEQSRVF
ncbi:MAG: hypothetical protein IJF71_06250 [Clostridia bacterium]|nr:hypothetical protein [Clostridia bacterium]